MPKKQRPTAAEVNTSNLKSIEWLREYVNNGTKGMTASELDTLKELVEDGNRRFNEHTLFMKLMRKAKTYARKINKLNTPKLTTLRLRQVFDEMLPKVSENYAFSSPLIDQAMREIAALPDGKEILQVATRRGVQTFCCDAGDRHNARLHAEIMGLDPDEHEDDNAGMLGVGF